MEDGRNSGLLGFIRRNSIGEKEGTKMKGKQVRPVYNSQRNIASRAEVRKGKDPEGKVFIEE